MDYNEGMTQVQQEYLQRYVVNSHVNPLKGAEYLPSNLKKTKEVIYEPSEKAELQAVQTAAHDFFSQTIKNELAKVLPEVAITYKPSPLAELWTYRGQELEKKGTNTSGEYWPGGHIFALNLDQAYPDVVWATIHETAHSVCRSLNEFQVVTDGNNKLTLIKHMASLTGFDVRSGKPTLGQVLNEGLMEYLTAEFLLNSTQPSAVKTKEHILKFIADFLGKDATSQTEPGYLATFAAGSYTEGSEYGEAYQIIHLLLRQHPELRPLFISSLVSPRAKFRLIQRLRELYGQDLTRELFHASMNENDANQVYKLQVLQEKLKQAGYTPRIERYGHAKPEQSLRTRLQQIFSGKS